MSLFSHKMKLADAIVGLMSCVSQVLSSTFYTFANSTLGMYIGTFFYPSKFAIFIHVVNFAPSAAGGGRKRAGGGDPESDCH